MRLLVAIPSTMIAVCLVCLMPARVQGAIVSGGSSLLSQADANQLETWLGEGTIEITRIYEKQAGDTSSDFHAAANNKGRTFSIIEVLAGNVIAYSTNAADLDHVDGFNSSSYYYDDNGQYHATTQYYGTTHIDRQVIGGFNPQSWGGSGYTPNDADRTAFLFNLTSSEVQHQNLTGEGEPGSGGYQTDNGPIFGGGNDIYVHLDLNTGRANNYSYGGTSILDNILAGGARYHHDFSIGRIEVFTIAESIETVPEPASLAIWGFGALGCTVLSRRRKPRRP